jgi:purine-nucleoside phosphorylase
VTDSAAPGSPATPGPGERFAESGAALIRERCDVTPEFGVVLGSGLGDVVGGDLEACHQFSFRALPGFPPSSVPGHAGRLAIGRLYGRPTAVFFGRVHYYEGHGIAATTLIPRLCSLLGVRVLVLTNSAGGIDPGIAPGRLMLIRDHINLMGVNPLFGWRMADGSPAFVDLSSVYDPSLRDAALSVAEAAGVDLGTGVYVALSGPSYETPAEIAFLASAGGNVVGMSTVPEAVAARALRLPVLGLSCITNTAGSSSGHEDVLRTARSAASDLRSILMGVMSGHSSTEDVPGPERATGGTGGL